MTISTTNLKTRANLQNGANINSWGAESNTLQSLKSEYKLLSLKLLECGQHVPGSDNTIDQEMAEREDRLITQQEDILDRVVALNISSKDEVGLLADLWMDVSSSEADPLPSTQLVKSIIDFNTKTSR